MKIVFLMLVFYTSASAMQHQVRERLLDIREEYGLDHELPVSIDRLFSWENRNTLLRHHTRAQAESVLALLARQEDPAYIDLACYCVSPAGGAQEHERQLGEAASVDGHSLGEVENEVGREILEQACLVRCVSVLVKRDRARADRQQRLITKYLWAYPCGKWFILLQMAALVIIIPYLSERAAGC